MILQRFSKQIAISLVPVPRYSEVRCMFKFVLQLAGWKIYTNVIHQPLLIAHKERVRLDNGQVVHPLLDRHNPHGLHVPSGAVGLPHVVADRQLTRIDPAPTL